LANTVTLQYRAQLAALIGTGGETISAGMVKDAIKYIQQKYGDQAAKTAKTMLIVVNGESILHLKLYKTVLKPGDVLGFLPICGGG
jgi:molybdopterin converting factor small subunit